MKQPVVQAADFNRNNNTSDFLESIQIERQGYSVRIHL